ncbi:MAG: hypothetical protein JWO06_3113, partial [Bacteroidota bacterium]|nr:hypothetical protein [Bacteroidota bacterium]
MKNYSLTGFAFCVCYFFGDMLCAQATTFAKTYGFSDYEIGFCLSGTPDGGFIFSGQTMSFGDSHGDTYVVKVDSDGIQQWAKKYGGSEEDGGNSVVPTADGGYFVTNHTESIGNGECDSWVFKTDAEGNVIWAQTYGYSLDDVGYHGIQTSDGRYVVTGLVHNLPDTLGDAFIARYDTDGTPLWVQSYITLKGDEGYRIVESRDNGFIVAGQTTDSTNGPEDMLLFKTDTGGNLIWTKKIGGAGYEEAYGLIATKDGNYMAAGFTTSFSLSEDAYLVKFDSAGNILWDKTYGGTTRDDRAYSVAET